MSRTWLLFKLTLLYALAAVVIAGLIWLVQRVPNPSPTALPTIYLFVAPLILGNVLLLSWCQIYNFRSNHQAA
jgi:hypothetical protein